MNTPMNKPRYRAVIQARMLSSRLRGKSLMAVAGVPLLRWVLDRAGQMPFLSDMVVATSTETADEPIALFAEKHGAKVIRGDKTDVLGRFVQACDDLDENDVLVRFTADNPLYDSVRSSRLWEQHQADLPDYTHIDGLSHMVPEFIRVGCLREVAALTNETFDREHVTVFVRQHPEQFRIKTLPPDFAGLRPEYDGQFTIDRQDQLDAFEAMIAEIIQSPYPVEVKLDDCYQWLDAKQRARVAQLLPGQKRVKFAGREVGDGCPCFIIAEIGQNHNGQLNLAKKLIDMAARCKADAVKFQKREISWELTKEAYHRPYEGPNSFGATYGSHREYLELNEAQHRELKEYAQAAGLIYFCTPCDPPSVDLLERVGSPMYKVASRDITNIPLLRHIAKTGKPVILSSGMSSLQELREAIEAFQGSRCDVTLMQCVSEYPAQPENVNLKAMATMRKEFDLLVGLSDHTAGVITGVAGAVLGAFAVEKHITMSRAMNGTDHAAALEEEGLKRLVSYIRICELAMGDGSKDFNPVVQAAKDKLARSLVSRTEIPSGSVLTEDMLILKSPGTGLSWNQRDQIVGHVAKTNIAAEVTLSPDQFN
jgi:sialic acid synthase SpsE/spore coat polysaccharide biosynthesis protein SpsF (cytidylyltransferase family)